MSIRLPRLLLTVPFGFAALSPAHAQEGGETIMLDTVTITSSKRPQALERADAAVSVATGEELAARNVSTVQDLEKVFPGLKINTRGNRTYANFTVRGISSPDFFSPSVQVYVDGVPQPPSAYSQPLIDVKRVEFVRGPQGTLYGGNALAGVINIITRKPDADRFYVQGTAGNRAAGAEIGGTRVLVPGSTYLDFALGGERRFGRIDDVSTGDDDIDTARDLTGRASLRYAPDGGGFDATFSVSKERLHSHEELYLFGDGVEDLEYQSALYGPRPDLTRDLTTASAQMNWRLDGWTLSSLSSFTRSDIGRDFPGMVPNFLFAWPQDEKTYSQELRAAYEGDGPVSGLLGLWYQHDDFESRKNAFPGFYGESVNRVRSDAAAAFGEATWQASDRLALTAGARLSYDAPSIDARRADTFGTGFGFDFERDADYTDIQPKIAIGYQITDATRLYATVARGYKPGGFNHSVSSLVDAEPYEPETAINYEAGVKSIGLLDGRLDLTLAAYLITSKDKQIYVGPIGQQTIRNAGEAESKGVEIEAAFRPTDALTLTGNLALGRSRFTDFVDRAAGISYDGKTVPYAPDVTGRLLASWLLPQEAIPADITLSGGLNYAGRTYFDEANLADQPAVATIDAGLDLDFRNGLTAKLFALNIADEIVRTSGYVAGGRQFSTVDTGRSFGITLRKEF
ncbi:TonB-dependent receptor [Antarcticirhabdus aurantiaca]|uniref:TonB-dependent receptor n=1 Tax=Antarcticirhabdus aurantiaca TaxID=2606717 RepID=A0ACD4NNY6_9HYPH|nr:TonB-dependent receptor [Antarcticirhabdus aurantiaca]WAJ28492.1 TonB-dependent receptor [Jeongeuplla avenae]